MKGELHRADDGEALWKVLVLAAGLDVAGHDAVLAAGVAERLDVDAAALPGCLRRFSAADVLRAFLAEAEPFVTMWTDLLALFEAAEATQGLSNLELAYDFGGEQPNLDFDLTSFRRWLAVAREAVARHWLTDDALVRVWELNALLKRGRQPTADPAPARTEIQEMTSTLPFAVWPEQLPQRPVFSDARFDELAEEAWAVAERYLRALRTISTGHDDGPRREPAETVVFDGASESSIWQPEVDYWLGFFLRSYDEAHRADQSGGRGIDWVGSASDLDSSLEPFRNGDDRHTEIVEQLSSLLDLPIWKHRYDLYSNWVCTQVVSALAAERPRVHADGGRIEFRFSGTHLATFDGFSPRLHLWTELRTPLTAPVGRRKANVQPDMVLRLDPLTSDLVPLAVECKHYRKPANPSFAHALTDYARAHAQAQVVLVDHGAVDEETVKTKVGTDVVDRTHVVADLRPGNGVGLARFADEVRAATRELRRSRGAPVRPQPTTGAMIERSMATIRLRWSTPPRDLDLHVTVPGPDGGHEISFADLGHIDEHPFCTLDQDITDGSAPEVARVHRWLSGTYLVHVMVYSRDQPAQIDASVEVEIDGQLLVMPWPAGHSNPSWQVCTIDGETRTVTVSA